MLPGVLLQLLMQILCIVEGVREDNRKPLHRTLYILSIAFFGLAAIAFHLLRTEKKLPKDATAAEAERANHLSNKGIFFLLAISYQVMGLHMLAENTGTPVYNPLLWLLTISFLIMLLYNLLPEEKRPITETLLPMLQLILCIPIQYLDVSGDNLFLSIIAGFSAINHASLPRARIYGIGALGAYLLGSTARTISQSAEMSDFLFAISSSTRLGFSCPACVLHIKKADDTSIVRVCPTHVLKNNPNLKFSCSRRTKSHRC